MKLNFTQEQIINEIKADPQFSKFLQTDFPDAHHIFTADGISFVIFHRIDDKFDIYVTALELCHGISAQKIGEFAHNVLEAISHLL